LSNEVFVDVTEMINVTVSPEGRIDFCHISDTVEITNHFSNTPTCKLILTPSSHYEDVVFHRAVEVEAQETKVIPPDGQLILM
jgi:hypothetical protein